MCWRFDAMVGHMGFNPDKMCIRCLVRPRERNKSYCEQCLTEIRQRGTLCTPRIVHEIVPTGFQHDHIDNVESYRDQHWGYGYRLASGFSLLGQGGFGDQFRSNPSFPTMRANGHPEPITKSDEDADLSIDYHRATGKWLSARKIREQLAGEAGAELTALIERRTTAATAEGAGHVC